MTSPKNKYVVRIPSSIDGCSWEYYITFNFETIARFYKERDAIEYVAWKNSSMEVEL